MRDSLARGLWLREKLEESNIPGDPWRPQAVAEWIGDCLLHFPCDAPGELAEEYGQRLLDASKLDDNNAVTELIQEFKTALEAYLTKHGEQATA